jgi:alpha-tubulin suppressor-like RCC1 family protein
VSWHVFEQHISTGECMKTLQKILVVVAALGLLAVAGCEKPLDLTMQRNRIFLMGRLLAGKTCDVRLIWRKAPEDQVPVTVTADLSEIGGDAEQELSPDDNNTGTWRWSGQVTPDVSGERLITITAVDAQVQKKEMSKRFPVFNTDKAIAIGAGSYQLLAVKADGTVVAWGCEELDTSDKGQCDVPATITNAVAVAGGDYHSIALNADGTVAAWGQYFADSPQAMYVPEALGDVVAIAASTCHNLALKADGTVVAWGRNDFGECDVPADLTDVIAIAAAGGGTSLALKADGTVISWGQEVIIKTHNAIAVSAGGCGSIIVLNEYGDASVYSNTAYYPSTPVRVGRGFKAVAAGTRGGGLGLRKDATVVSWTYVDPIPWSYYYVNEGPGNVLAIAMGQYYDFRMALAADGSLEVWSDNWNGHIEQPVPDELQ